ncbi:extracellular solute-binding protein family 1 [Desulfatibacillum aliphaticivorans]|uniref:Extracellular solute-binding protein family 1 n=1 Tax=Desulfatibacillum aliphaticivorans TaxID=218208 RepID=B8FIJ6_DESAL|nr:extracellular solute-binding protein [Desulfatibacillum aliphaticivorans]ACL03986.1 extracellular solute-binding protein family 1 [Desulfatibacillum aliphaticivorans]
MKYWRILLLIVLAGGLATSASAEEVVVYTSVDRMFSEPILQKFEKDTGIKVLAMYDVEASKTVGLVNRLIAEKRRPRADVFWNSEVIRTIQLLKEDVLTPYKSVYYDDFPTTFKDKDGYWTGFAGRARVLLINATMIQERDLPPSILDFTKPEWKGKVTIAYPLFGTTAMHVAALYDYIGTEKTEAYLKGLAANDVLVVDGNSVTRDLVVQGKVPVGFTDTDDAQVAIDKGDPVQMIFPDSTGMGTLLIPNTVMMIKGAPHPETGKKLIDYLLSPETEKALQEGESAQIPLRKGSSPPGFKAMEVDYAKVAGYLEPSAKLCQEIFMR